MSLAAPPAITADEITLTLSFERADGLERVGFLCLIARAIAEAPNQSDNASNLDGILMQVAPWFEREFEQTREAALKSLRGERKPHVVRFDREHPGPFAA